MARKKDNTTLILTLGGIAAGGGILYYLYSSGALSEMFSSPTPEAAPVATVPVQQQPQTVPGVTDFPTLTETLNAPMPRTGTGSSQYTPATPSAPSNTTPANTTFPCPSGYTGTWPDCEPINITATPTCPSGWTGTYPNCVPPTPLCPTGWTGTYPACIPPATPTTPAPTPNCVKNSSLCSSKYHGKCSTECQNASSSDCTSCRCACEGVSSNLALAYAGSRQSDDGVVDRAYIVRMVGPVY